jgi:hypothetical protein
LYHINRSELQKKQKGKSNMKGQKKYLKISMAFLALVTFLMSDALCKSKIAKEVIVTDFSKFHPSSAVSTENEANKWFLRFVPWAKKGGTMLNIASGYPEDISFNPGLKGAYDLYVGVHKVNAYSRFQIKVGNTPYAYTINVGKFHKKPFSQRESNKCILYAKNVEMNGKSITLKCYGDKRVYIDYLKFVPADSNSKLSFDYVKREKEISIVDLKKARANYIPPRFFEKKYRDRTPMPKISNEAREQGYIVFTRNYMHNVFPTSVPRQEEINRPLKTFASLGEYEPVSFAIRAFINLENVKITVSNLVHEEGSVIPAGNVDVRQLGIIRKRSRFYRAREYMNVPLILEKRTRYSIPKNVSTCFWATVKVPNKKLPYGNYNGSIKISPSNASAYKLPLTLKVLPFKLEEPKDLYVAANDVATFNHLGTTDYLNEKFNDMRAHGMTSITWWFEDFKLKFKFNENDVKVIFDGSSSLEKVMRAYKKAGFPCKKIYFFMGRQLEYIARSKGGKCNFEKFYKQIIRQIVTEGKKRGWPQFILNPVDEAASQGTLPVAALMTKLTKEAEATTGADHLPLFPRNDLERKYVPQILKYTDVVNNGFSLNNRLYKAELEDIFKRAQKLKKILYTYNLNNGLQMPEMTSYRFGTGYFFLTIGKPVKGQCIYMYNHISDSPYNDLDSADSDNMLVYPANSALDRPGGPTVCWEAVREGMDDYKYVYTLKNCIRKILAVPNPEYSEARAMANEAKKKLNNILNSFDFSLMRKMCKQKIESTWDKTGFNYVEGKYLLRNGWDYEDYQNNREIIANEIMKLITIMPGD